MTDVPSTGVQQLSETLLEEGAIWFARMRGPDAGDFQIEFEQWRTRSALHQAAYERAGEIYAAGRFLAAERKSHTRIANDNVRSTGGTLRWLAVAAVVGLGVALIAMVLQQRSMGVGSENHDIAQVGDSSEQRQYVGGDGASGPVRLSDGSLITLKPGTIVSQHFSADRRELRLEKGEARFEVAHEGRPFVVRAGGGSVTARGTIFDVRLAEGHQVVVKLLRGAIDIERPKQPDGESSPFSRLAAGESLSFLSNDAPTGPASSAGIPASIPAPVDYAKPREFDRTPLTAVLAETRAASGVTILVADAGLGQMRVSGRFRVDDGQQVAERLAALFDLKVEQSAPDQVTLRQKN